MLDISALPVGCSIVVSTSDQSVSEQLALFTLCWLSKSTRYLVCGHETAKTIFKVLALTDKQIENAQLRSYICSAQWIKFHSFRGMNAADQETELKTIIDTHISINELNALNCISMNKLQNLVASLQNFSVMQHIVHGFEIMVSLKEWRTAIRRYKDQSSITALAPLLKDNAPNDVEINDGTSPHRKISVGLKSITTISHMRLLIGIITPPQVMLY